MLTMTVMSRKRTAAACRRNKLIKLSKREKHFNLKLILRIICQKFPKISIVLILSRNCCQVTRIDRSDRLWFRMFTRLVCDLAEAADRPLVAQSVFPAQVEAPLLPRDERLGSGVWGPGLHPWPGPEGGASVCPPRPSAGH